MCRCSGSAIASKLAGNDPDINVALALFITTGHPRHLLGGAADSAHGIRNHWVERGGAAGARSAACPGTGASETSPTGTGEHKSDPVERLFILSALLGIVAFEVWFFFFAGSPLPSQPVMPVETGEPEDGD